MTKPRKPASPSVHLVLLVLIIVAVLATLTMCNGYRLNIVSNLFSLSLEPSPVVSVVEARQ